MYRIRRETGDEVTLGSLEELGTAVAAGIVTAGAEIYHARAEKWLPIASHPHFKMANDRVKAGAAQKAAAPRASARTASGQRPALGASGQRPAITAPREPAPHLRSVRAESPADRTASAGAPAIETGLAPAAERPAARWSAPQRPNTKVPAAKPVAPVAEAAAPVVPDLSIVRADALVHETATATEPSEMEFELLPVLDEPRVVEQRVAPSDAAEVRNGEALLITSISDEPVEQSPASIELVSHEDKAHQKKPELATSTGVEIINPDRSMPSMMDEAEVAALEIPAPVRDFATDEPVAAPVAKSASKLPVMIGFVVAAAAAIGFFVLKPGQAPAPAPTTVATAPAPVSVPNPPAAAEPVATINATPAPVAPPVTNAVTPPSGASAGLGGDAPKKLKKTGENGDAKTTDGLAPPPEDVMPAAPTLGGVTDPSLTSVETGTATSPVDRTKALEKARNDIDSSMRH